MMIIRACYHIFLSTKNPVNLTTARASLTQILSVVFLRMENACETMRLTGMDAKLLSKDAPKEKSSYEICHDITVNIVEMIPKFSSHHPEELKILDVGKYGACTFCAQSADFYDVDSQDPFCSLLCRRKFLASKQSLESTLTLKKARLFLHDVLVVFRALCKLCGKAITSSTDIIGSRSKTLSLELLLHVIEKSGPTFRTQEIFVDAIREHLIMGLLKNCVSTDVDVFRLSVSIFASLIAGFRSNLKAEIGAILDNIFLKIGASGNSSFNQRVLVLEVLCKICQDSESIIDIFLNYDCDNSSSNIYENTVLLLDKIAKGR